MIIEAKVEIRNQKHDPYVISFVMDEEACARLGCAEKIIEHFESGFRAMIRRIKDKKILDEIKR